MEPSHSQIPGGAEESHSSESGWTMYLGSPIDDDDDDDEEEEEEENKAYAPDDESDDSMTSDASSGPSHHCGNPWGISSKGGHVEDEEAVVKTKEKEVAEKKEEKKEMAFMNNKGKFPNEKVRKNHWMGKRN